MSAYAGKNRTSILNRYWQRHISDKNGIWFDVPPAVAWPHGRCLHGAVPQATFTYALTLMGKVGGWNDEKWIGPKFAACVRMYTTAVYNKKCSGEPSLDLGFAQGIIGESVTWVTEVCLWEHEWIMDADVTLKENEILEALNCEIKCLAHSSGDFCGSQHRLTSTTSS